MAKKAVTTTKASITVKVPSPSLGPVVMVYTKSSSHWYALLEPKVITIEGLKFVEGIQVTGKEGHRMEKKRTLIPFEHVASLIQFETEEDLWSEPQPKHIAPPNWEKPSTTLTSHEQNLGQQPSRQGGGQPHRSDDHHRSDDRRDGGRHRGHHRNNRGRHGRFPK